MPKNNLPSHDFMLIPFEGAKHQYRLNDSDSSETANQRSLNISAIPNLKIHSEDFKNLYHEFRKTLAEKKKDMNLLSYNIWNLP